MGVVYEAHDPRLDRKVAIKTIRTEDLTPSQAKAYEARFLTEARSVARLGHPHIVSVYDSGQSGDVTYLVMEYVAGINLKHCLNHGVVFSPLGAIRIVCGVLTALGHAHEQKIVHRDVKPENILMDANGWVKLTDFGIAKILDAEVDNGTQVSGHSIGTPRYMSPEQVRGLALDERSDLFSAGILLYELLTGTLPFDGPNQLAIATQILHDQPASPSRLNPMVPQSLDLIMQRALAKRPEDRYQHVDAFRVALEAAATAWPQAVLSRPVDSATELVTSESAGILRWLLDKTPWSVQQNGSTAPDALTATQSGMGQTGGGRTGSRSLTGARGASTVPLPRSDEGTLVFPRTRPMGLDGLAGPISRPGPQAVPPPSAPASSPASTPASTPAAASAGPTAVPGAAAAGVAVVPVPSGAQAKPAASDALAAARVPPAPVGTDPGHRPPGTPWIWAMASGAVLVAALAWFWTSRAPAGTAIADPTQTLAPSEELVPTATGPAATDPAPAPAPSEWTTGTGATAPTATATPAGASPSATSAPPKEAPRKPRAKPAEPAPAPDPAPTVSSTAPQSEPSRTDANHATAPPAPKPAPPPAPAEPCKGLSFFERESCLWTACKTEPARKHPACSRFVNGPAN